MFEDILAKIKEYDSIIIHRHLRPDGDCIGCQLGLKHLILNSFPNKKVYSVGNDAPKYLESMLEKDQVDDSLYAESLVIVVDTATESRISDDRWKTGKFIIKIDHHDDSPDYANINYVDPTAPACAVLMVRMFNELKGELKMNSVAAKYLYYGIVTDTGRFRYRGVDSETFKAAGTLLEYNVDIYTMYDDLYITDSDLIRNKAYVYQHFKMTPNGVAYMYFSKKIMKKLQISIDDASNLVNNLDCIYGSLIWVAFIDQLKPSDPTKKPNPAKEIRCRLRSRHVQINDIATHYRGGGHLQAAGATIYSKKEMNDLLAELDLRLGEYKKDHPDAK